MENSTTYTCKRCGYCSAAKKNVIQHLNRKNTCVATLQDIPPAELISELTHRELNEVTFDCRFCEKKFNSQASRSQHHRRCKKREEKLEKLESAYAKLLEQNENLQKRLETIEASNASTKSTANNGSCTINNGTIINGGNVNIQNNIVIKDFGKENVDFLPKEFLTRCFARKDIVCLLENLHCDKEHPENHNVRVKSRKQNLMEIRESNKWVFKDEDETLTELIQNGYRILLWHGRKHKDEIIEDELDGEEEFHSINDWLEAMYNDKKEQKPIKRKLLLVLLNNRALLLGKDEE